MAAAFSCFDSSPSLKLNVSVIPKYAEYLKSKGVSGLLVNGTTGEHVLMSVEERKSATEVWVEAAQKQGQTLMVQIGGASLPDVLHLASHAESLKVPGILCLPELFFKPKNVPELIAYLKLVSKSAPKTPLFYYHNPGFTGINLPMSQLLKKGKKEIPTFSGIKFTSNDMDEGSKCLNIDEDYTIFLGSNTIFPGALALGFDSGITSIYNFWPEDYREIMRLMKEGKIEEAKSVQSKITENINIIQSDESPRKKYWLGHCKLLQNYWKPVEATVKLKLLYNKSKLNPTEQDNSSHLLSYPPGPMAPKSGVSRSLPT